MTKVIKEHYKKRLEEITKSDIEKGEVIFAGDCVIEYYDCEHFLPDANIYNHGIGGDTTDSLKKSLFKRVIKHKPRKLFISIGSNDFGFDQKSVKEIYNNIMEIIEEVRRRSKKTEIYLLSVLPVNPANLESINRDYVDSRDNYEINMLNYYLRNYARKNRIKFIDLKEHLATSFDQLDLKYTFDGFHLNEHGYDQVTKLIKQFI